MLLTGSADLIVTRTALSIVDMEGARLDGHLPYLR